MKKSLFTLLFVFSSLVANAQLGYWVRKGFVELTPDESFVYKYVKAMDDQSRETMLDLYDNMKETGDKSIIKCNETGGNDSWYVRKDYSLPEGKYFESDFYDHKLGDQGENYYQVILPQVQSFLNSRGNIEDLLEYLGDQVTVDLIKENDVEGVKTTDFRFISNLKTSEEWLKLCLDVYNHGFEGLHYFSPHYFRIDKTYFSHLINELKGENDDKTLVYSMNWEGADLPMTCVSPDDPWKSTDEGLAIVNPEKQMYIASISTIISGGGFPILEDKDYLVRLTMKVPSDGIYTLSLFNGRVSSCLEVPVYGSDDFQVIDILYTDLSDKVMLGAGSERNVILTLNSGWVVGTTVLKKVEVYELAESTARGGDKTAINAVKATNADGAIYNLSGQKIDASYKGIVIQNGKKRIAH